MIIDGADSEPLVNLSDNDLDSLLAIPDSWNVDRLVTEAGIPTPRHPAERSTKVDTSLIHVLDEELASANDLAAIATATRCILEVCRGTLVENMSLKAQIRRRDELEFERHQQLIKVAKRLNDELNLLKSRSKRSES